MKIGDCVYHINRQDITGIVVAFTERTGGVLVDLSDERGIMFRWFYKSNLRVVE